MQRNPPSRIAVRVGVSLALAVGFCVAEPGADALPTEPKETLQWFEPVPAGGTVRAVNPMGNVYARFGGYEDKVEILATVQKLDAGLPPLEVARIGGDAGLEIVVGHRTGEGRPERARETARDRVDLVLFVPLGATLDAETLDGLIEVKGLKSDLIASTLTGDVRVLGVRGRVRVKSARGAISATLETGVTAERQEFTTETGDIEIHVWEDAQLEARIATSGEITSDFSVEIEHRRFEEPGKLALAVLGEGGPSLQLQSKRGRIKLLRLPRHYRTDD